MAWRAIHDTVSRSESLAALTDLAERLYWRLLAQTDSYGRVAGSPAKIRAQCIPLLDVTNEQIRDALDELEQVARVWYYAADDTTAIQIVDFEEHQPKDLKRKRGEAKLPECPPGSLLTSEGRQGLPQGRRYTAYAHLAYEALCKHPANPPEGRTRAGNDGPRAAQSRVEESRKDLAAAASVDLDLPRAREPGPEPDGADAAAASTELDELLEELALPKSLRAQALAEPGRALAVARYTIANHGTGAYFRTVFESGDWPETVAASNGGGPPADPVVRRRRFVEGDGHRLPADELEFQLGELGAVDDELVSLLDLAADLRAAEQVA